METPTKTTEPPDFWSLHARKLLGMPDEWRWFRLEALEDPNRTALVTGAIPNGVLKSGPHKGEPNWRGRTDERRVAIRMSDHDAFIAEWERETGKCSRCGGDGVATYGWSRDGGTKTQPCGSCGGAGTRAA